MRKLSLLLLPLLAIGCGNSSPSHGVDMPPPPDTAAPDTAAPDMATPDMATPDMATPDMMVADMKSPDMKAPDAPPADTLPAPCGGGTSCTVFVTNQNNFTGNLGGVAGANATCQAAATAAGLTGTFKAWLSDTTGNSPATKFTHAAVPYKLVNGTTIAANWTGLTSGVLLAPISVSESGVTVTGPVWTSTNKDGTSGASAADCTDWTDGMSCDHSGCDKGLNGDCSSMTAGWTQAGGQYCNDPLGQKFRLYCFQQ